MEKSFRILGDPETLYSAIIIKAGIPDENGNIYTTEVLKKAAEQNPKELKFEHDCLYGIGGVKS